MSSVGKKRPDPAGMDASNIVDGPRKRQHTAQHNQSGSQLEDHATAAPRKITLKLKPQQQSGGGGTTQELGLKLWAAVKQAKGAGGALLAPDFYELPSKKAYPDYYQFIKNPISLKEIKQKLDASTYPTLAATKADFDMMFANAMQYNMPGSGIWKTTEALIKILNAEYRSLVGQAPAAAPVEPEVPEDGEDEIDLPDEPGPSARSSAKTKSPNLTQLLRTRLKKLINTRDTTGRYLNEVFMDPPSKKDYPSYYKIIKKVMTFGMIQKKLSDKGYQDPQAFVNDVELIFSNAFTFNEEGSIVHNDAKILQEAFRQLMSDLPHPYTLATIAPSAPPQKIKLKVPVQQAAAATPAGSQKDSPAPTPAALPEPAPVAKPDPSPKPSASATPAPVTTPAPTPSAVPPPQPIAPAPIAVTAPPATVAQTAYTPQAQYSYYQPQPIAPAVTALSPVPPVTTSTAPVSASSKLKATPAQRKPPPATKLIKGLTVRTTPAGRKMRFENTVEGLELRLWSLRLGPGESGAVVEDLEVYEKGKDEDADDAMEVDGGTVSNVEVKVNALVVTPQQVPGQEQPNGVIPNGNGNGTASHDEDSDLSEPEGPQRPKRSTRKPPTVAPAKKTRGKKGAGKKPELKVRKELNLWDASSILTIGSNTVEVKVSTTGASENWKVFLERVL